MTLKELQAVIDVWIKNYGVRYFNELTNLGILTEEVGELSRYMVRIFGEQSFKDENDKETARDKFAEEIGDVLFVLVCIANQSGLDLNSIMQKNINKKTERDKTRHLQNEKLK